MTQTQFIFRIATCLYGMSLVSTSLAVRWPKAYLLFLIPAVIFNAVAVEMRCWTAWPMLPMVLGPVALPMVLGILAALVYGNDHNAVFARRSILTIIVLLSLLAVLFPKDYYIPFIHSQAVWAHLFFWFGAVGKGCFFVAAAWALAGLRERDGKSKILRTGNMEKKRGKEETPTSPCQPLSTSSHFFVSGSPLFRISTNWAIWGFAFWTLSMFAGELWSYLGWGTPVVWDDPAITTTMATWFFYVCLLHLHLTGSWSARSRGIYTATGAIVVLLLNCLPDAGPLRWPL